MFSVAPTKSDLQLSCLFSADAQYQLLTAVRSTLPPGAQGVTASLFRYRPGTFQRITSCVGWFVDEDVQGHEAATPRHVAK